jgi:hypothetical protein
MKHVVIPDIQAKPGHSFRYLERIGEYIVEKKPDVIVCIGDFADMPSLSSYDVGTKSFPVVWAKDSRNIPDVSSSDIVRNTRVRPV